jgi:hypothetical protein
VNNFNDLPRASPGSVSAVSRLPSSARRASSPIREPSGDENILLDPGCPANPALVQRRVPTSSVCVDQTK